MANQPHAGGAPRRRPYRAPRVSAVRLETKRTQLAFQFATGGTHCSFHYHDAAGAAGTTQDCTL